MAMLPGRAEHVSVAVFARAPLAGAAKTRLIPALGAVGAARLQRRLTLHALAVAQSASIGCITLWAAPDGSHRFFRAVQHRCGVDLRGQLGNDLGARMAHAFSVQAGPLLLIGTDCPALQAAHLLAAAEVLLDERQGGNDAVFIPADDGGYVLVGLRCPQQQLFEGIDWGSDRVMAQTRERLLLRGLRWVELPSLWDVDRPADLARLASLAGFAEVVAAIPSVPTGGASG